MQVKLESVLFKLSVITAILLVYTFEGIYLNIIAYTTVFSKSVDARPTWED